MRSTFKVFLIGFRVILRDVIMLVLIPAPFFVGIAFRCLLPITNQLLTQHFSFSITHYYALTDGLMIVAFAANRVEGLALSKLTGITMVSLFIPWFISDSWGWCMSILPTFWLGRMTQETSNDFTLFMGILTSLLWITFFIKRFLRKINR